MSFNMRASFQTTPNARQKAKRQREECLRELERKARAQWRSLMGK